MSKRMRRIRSRRSSKRLRDGAGADKGERKEKD
jgi:hypothetical protein